jgi:hypothetical protein
MIGEITTAHESGIFIRVRRNTNLAKECNLLRLQVFVLIEPIQCKIT